MDSMKKWREKIQRRLLRPFLYMTFTRFLLALTAGLLFNFFTQAARGQSMRAYAFLFLGVVFGLLAWIAYLRLDGVKLPKLMMLRVNPRKKPTRSYGDIIDYVDEHPPVTFEQLEDEEKDLCILGADVICCAAFILLSLIFP